MSRLVFICPYRKPGNGPRRQNLVRYMATREGVQHTDLTETDLPATDKQRSLIQKLVKEMPETADLMEYEAFQRLPTHGMADAFIQAGIEQAELRYDERKNFVDYMANRPKVQRVGKHGLFSYGSAPLVLDQVMREVADHPVHRHHWPGFRVGYAGGLIAMHWLSIILLGISTNFDNMFIGISLGLQGKHITLLMNTVIGLFSAVATLLVCLFSSQIAGGGRTADLIGGGMIILVGMAPLLPRKGEKPQPRVRTLLAWRDAALLGICLAVNCIPIAFGAGLTGLSPGAAALSVGMMSILSVAIGNHMGLAATALSLRERQLSILGGLIMVGLGIMEILI